MKNDPIAFALAVNAAHLERIRAATFRDWSPADLAHALGYRIDLRRRNNGTRTTYLIGPTGRAHLTSHQHACDALSRLAERRGLDPAKRPTDTPRALQNGREEAA